MDKIIENISEAAHLIKHAKFLTVFTGAGISKESGIPVFRGNDGIYSKYDPSLLELDSYLYNTAESWLAVKAIFYDFFAEAYPNPAHKILAKWEKLDIVKHIITQNIDNLHQEGGSTKVVEYHGTKDSFICLKCRNQYRLKTLQITDDAPTCPKCNALLKPEFIFFGENIVPKVSELSYQLANNSDVHIIIGASGDVFPAAHIPHYAKQAGAKIIEINPKTTNYTAKTTDIFINMPAVKAMQMLDEIISS